MVINHIRQIAIASLLMLVLWRNVSLGNDSIMSAESRQDAATPTPIAIIQPHSVANVVSVTRTLSESNSGATAQLRLSAVARPDGCYGIPAAPVDLAFLIDTSSSAGQGPGSNWEHTAATLHALLGQLEQSPVYADPHSPPVSSQASLVSSQTGTLGPEPVLLQPLTMDFSLLRNQLGSIQPSGDTELAAGLGVALNELAQASPERAKAVALVLHDNKAIDDSLRLAIEEAVAQDVAVFLVVNSRNIIPADVLTEPLATELVPADHVFIDPTPEALRELFVAATGGDANLAAKAVQIAELFQPADAIQIVDTRPDAHQEPGRLIWQAGDLIFGQRSDFEYSFTVPPTGATSSATCAPPPSRMSSTR